ncbi:MAG: tRNA lysidine(34) synthetase TilS [Acidobacteriota bacterium]
MHGFARSLITEWRRLELPFVDATIIIGVSGGADSVSLLMAMHELRQREKHGLRIVAAHFNHSLRGAESDADEAYVRALTSEHRIELAVGHGNIAAAGNLEQNARRARYAFLAETAENLRGAAILTGHTINDQAETFLMNLIRGSGIDGLSGIRPVRHLSELDSELILVRPLLSWSERGDTEQYCHDIGVAYRYDSMNEDTAFKRVRIRKILLPLLTDLNPNIIETLANTAILMQHAADGSGAADFEVLPDKLELKELKMLEKGELYSTLRIWLTQMRGSSRQLQLKHIQAIERLVFSDKSGRRAELPGGATVVKSRGKLAFDAN